MKKIYICPALDVNEVQLQSLLAESLKINNTPVDGSQALSKEESWDIWNDE